MYCNRKFLKLNIILILFCLLINAGWAANREESEKLTIKGMKALKDNNLAPARKLLTQAVEEDPTFDRAHEALGDLFLLEGSYDDAVMEYEKASNLGGDSVEITYKIARSRYGQQQYDKAVIHLEKLKKAYQDNPEYFFLMGESYRKLNDFTKAQVNLERVIAQDKNSLKAHLSLGRLYYDSQMWPEAREHFVFVLDHPDTDEQTKEEMKKLIAETETRRSENKLWHLAIPIFVVIIIVPSYLYLKKHKKEHPESLEEEFDG